MWCRVFDFITAGWVVSVWAPRWVQPGHCCHRVLCKSQRVQLTRLYVTIVLTVLAFPALRPPALRPLVPLNLDSG